MTSVSDILRAAAENATDRVARTDPLYDQIYDIMWRKILDGAVPVGKRLRDVEWAENLNVSRTPVREAFRKLQQDGILDPVANGGYVLKAIGPSDLNLLYRCRAVLEALAVRDFKGEISRADIDALYALIKKTRERLAERAFQEVFMLNTRFHRYFIEGSQNPYARHVIEHISRLTLYARSSLKLMIEKNPVLTNDYVDHLLLNQKWHEQILALVEKGDFDAAGDAMQNHLFETGVGMQELISREK
ncbi:MAG: GntR family transcriptional regulator [Pseudolabrys sp.]